MKKTLVRYFLFIFLLLLGSSGRIFAQQGFGTKEPSKASVVDMQSENRGLLIPRVALTNLTTFLPNTGENPADATSTSKTNALLVYNTATAGVAPYIVTPGYYYWTSANQRWNRLVVSQDLSTTTTTANNGLTKTDNNIQLGGQLEDDTVIDLNDNTLAIEGLPAGSSTDKTVVADPTTGVLKQVKQAPKFFYMPSVIFDTSVQGTYTRNLYVEYKKQFEGEAVYITGENGNNPIGGAPIQYTGGLVRSPDAVTANITPPVFESNELHYIVTYYDETVFEDLSLTNDGKLTYTVKAGASEYSYMNIVFVIKD
jgi:hypothetical protein